MVDILQVLNHSAQDASAEGEQVAQAADPNATPVDPTAQAIAAQGMNQPIAAQAPQASQAPVDPARAMDPTGHPSDVASTISRALQTATGAQQHFLDMVGQETQTVQSINDRTSGAMNTVQSDVETNYSAIQRALANEAKAASYPAGLRRVIGLFNPDYNEGLQDITIKGAQTNLDAASNKIKSLDMSRALALSSSSARVQSAKDILSANAEQTDAVLKAAGVGLQLAGNTRAEAELKLGQSANTRAQLLAQPSIDKAGISKLTSDEIDTQIAQGAKSQFPQGLLMEAKQQREDNQLHTLSMIQAFQTHDLAMQDLATKKWMETMDSTHLQSFIDQAKQQGGKFIMPDLTSPTKDDSGKVTGYNPVVDDKGRPLTVRLATLQAGLKDATTREGQEATDRIDLMSQQVDLAGRAAKSLVDYQALAGSGGLPRDVQLLVDGTRGQFSALMAAGSKVQSDGGDLTKVPEYFAQAKAMLDKIDKVQSDAIAAHVATFPAPQQAAVKNYFDNGGNVTNQGAARTLVSDAIRQTNTADGTIYQDAWRTASDLAQSIDQNQNILDVGAVAGVGKGGQLLAFPQRKADDKSILDMAIRNKTVDAAQQAAISKAATEAAIGDMMVTAGAASPFAGMLNKDGKLMPEFYMDAKGQFSSQVLMEKLHEKTIAMQRAGQLNEGVTLEDNFLNRLGDGDFKNTFANKIRAAAGPEVQSFAMQLKPVQSYINNQYQAFQTVLPQARANVQQRTAQQEASSRQTAQILNSLLAGSPQKGKMTPEDLKTLTSVVSNLTAPKQSNPGRSSSLALPNTTAPNANPLAAGGVGYADPTMATRNFATAQSLSGILGMDQGEVLRILTQRPNAGTSTQPGHVPGALE